MENHIIQATLDLTNNKWKLPTTTINGGDNMLLQLNVLDTTPSSINHLQFGFVLSLNDEIIETDTFPQGGVVKFLGTGNIISNSVPVSSNTTYSLNLWAQNGLDRIEKTANIKVSRPVQPYVSWTWNGSDWAAPVPEPTNGPKDAAYIWSERQQQWFLLVPPLSQFDDI